MSDAQASGGSDWKQGLAFLFGFAGFMMGGVAAYTAFGAQGDVDQLRIGMADTGESDEEVIVTLAEKTELLRRDVAAANKRLSALDEKHDETLAKMREVLRRLIVIESIEVRDGNVRMPPGTPEATDMKIGAIAYERLRNQALTSETDDQTQYVFLLEANRRGKLRDLEKELTTRVEANPGKVWLQGLLDKARRLLEE